MLNDILRSKVAFPLSRSINNSTVLRCLPVPCCDTNFVAWTWPGHGLDMAWTWPGHGLDVQTILKLHWMDSWYKKIAPHVEQSYRITIFERVWWFEYA